MSRFSVGGILVWWLFTMSSSSLKPYSIQRNQFQIKTEEWVSEQIFNGTSTKIGYTVPFTWAYAGKYGQKNKSETDITKTKHNPEKSKQRKTQQNKNNTVPWFSRLIRHSARERGGLILQRSWAHTGQIKTETSYGFKKQSNALSCFHYKISSISWRQETIFTRFMTAVLISYNWTELHHITVHQCVFTSHYIFKTLLIIWIIALSHTPRVDSGRNPLQWLSRKRFLFHNSGGDMPCRTLM